MYKLFLTEKKPFSSHICCCIVSVKILFKNAIQKLTVLLLAASFLYFPPSLSWAQQEDLRKETALEPVVVTDKRYKSELKETPSSIQIITGEDIQKKGIRRLSDALRLVPNIYVYDDGGSFNTAIIIRGIGNEIPFTEPAVSVFIDGIPFSGNMSDFNLSNNVARIEIMRGPQSTLFGQNTLAGAVNIVTKKAYSEEFIANITGKIGSYGYKKTSIGLSGADPEGTAWFSFDAAQSSSDGFLKNTITGNDRVGGQDNEQLRAVLGIVPYEGFEISLVLDHNEEKGAKIDAVERHSYEFSRSVDPEEIRKSQQGSLSISWQLNTFKLSSLSGLRDVQLDLKDNMVQIFGSETLNLVNTQEKKFFQEFRLVQPKEYTDLGWQIGIFLSDKNFDVDQSFSIPAFAVTQQFDHQQDSLRMETYAQADYEFIPNLTLTAGGRFSQVKRKVNHQYSVNGFTVFTTDGQIEKTYKNSVGHMALTYDISANTTVYSSFSQGFKAGTSRSGAIDIVGLFLPSEESNTFEVGMKGNIKKLRYSTSIFYTDYKNRHTFYNDNVNIPEVIAIPDATSMGAELSLDYQLHHNWSMFGHVGYLNTEFGKYILPRSRINIKGNKFRGAPEWSFAFGTDYSTIIGDNWQLFLNSHITFQSKTQGNVANNYISINPAYSLVNISTGLKKGNLLLNLSIENLLDRYYFTTTAMNNGTGSPGAPRSIFLTTSYKF